MPKIRTTWEALEKGVKLATDVRHTFVIPRAYAHVLTLPSALLEKHSAVPHERPVPAPVDLKTPLHTLSGSLAAIIRYAEAHPDYKLLIAGHASSPPSSGANGHGMPFAKGRAEAVHALLVGDRDAFAKACTFSMPGDDVRVLRWLASAFGYPCDVPEGKQASAALKAFRRHHIEQHGGSFPNIPAARPEDFAVFYDFYEQCLADALDTDVAGLPAYRDKLTCLDPPVDTCGDFWPLPPHGTERVDAFFFEPPESVPDYAGDYAKRKWKPGTSLYFEERRVRRLHEESQPEPAAMCVRMTGMYFDTNKCFLLPSAMTGLRKLIAQHAAHPEGELLVVGHTDTSGTPSVNDPLSLQRAEAVVAYLTDDVDAWLARYGKDKPQAQRWGDKEDQLMLRALPDAAPHFSDAESIKSYQRSRALSDDGICGPNTRKRLIADYMAIDGTSLPAGIRPVAHGCGENFPLVKTGDGVGEGRNRRVELFHFSESVDPAPPGDNSPPRSREYPTWKQRVVHTHRLDLDPVPMGHICVKLYSPKGFPVVGVTVRAQGQRPEFATLAPRTSDEEGHVHWDRTPLTTCELELALGGQTARVCVPWQGAADPPHLLSVRDLGALLGGQASPHGTQVRLWGLGHDCGSVDGDLAARATVDALTAFQKAHGLTAGGELDAMTGHALRDHFGA